MSDFLKDYKAYYAARAKRFEGDKDYPNMEKAEADLNKAMQSCNELVEFKDRLGNLNELCAVALIKDQYKIRLDHYLEIKEVIRALGPQRIIEKADGHNNVMDLITMVTGEENINMIEITLDDASALKSYWFMLERIEEYERAEVPDKWKKDHQESADDNKKSICEGLALMETEYSKWKEGWKFNPLLVSEERHRRNLSYPEEEIEKKIEPI